MIGILTLLLLIIEILIPIGIIILIILGIKALRNHLRKEKETRIIEDEIYRTIEEVDEIEKEINELTKHWKK